MVGVEYYGSRGGHRMVWGLQVWSMKVRCLVYLITIMCVRGQAQES